MTDRASEARCAIVRPMSAADVPAVCEIQALCPGIAQWSASGYARVGLEFSGWIAEAHGAASGFVIARCSGGELEILNLAVHPRSRRRGTGKNLLLAAIQWAETCGARQAFLEVRRSNDAALGLYSRMGFRVDGKRLAYYPRPPEDALVLTRRLRARREGAAILPASSGPA